VTVGYLAGVLLPLRTLMRGARHRQAVVVIKAYIADESLSKNETSRFPRIGSRLIASWGSGGGVGRLQMTTVPLRFMATASRMCLQ
jgi:hypothetical protein